MDDHTGEQFGDYRLTQILGRGNFGDVYLGEHNKNKKQAAIKVLHARLTNKEDLKDYINELRSLFRLEHPNIVRLRDFGIERDFRYFVMDYIPNGRLRQPKGTRLPLNTVVSYVKQIADALQYAHDQGIIHRDVKPDNILLGPNAQVWLSDFGIAAVAHSTNSFNNQGNAGTIAYMAPEQLQGKPGKASDQYALGIMTYEWICGVRPFNGTSFEINNQHLYTSPPSMREFVPTLSPLVEEVVLKALAKDAKQRFTNLRAFANALEQAAATESRIAPSIESKQNDKAEPKVEPVKPVVEVKDADSSLVTGDEWVKPSPPSPHTGPFIAPVVLIPEDENAEPVRPRSKTGSIPVPMPLPQTGATTKPLAPGAGSAGAGAAAAFAATNRASVAGGTQPPIRGNVGGSGGGGGGGRSRRRSTRQLLAIALVILTLLLLAGIAFASPSGQNLIGHITGSTSTAIVTITPAHQTVSDSFVVTALTGTPDPTAHQVQARVLSYTSPSGSGSASATGSLPAKQASGTLRFVNSGTFSVRVLGGILTGGDGVQISFGTVVVPVGSIDTTGIVVNLGASGNIPAFDINGTCCGNSNITVRNLFPFSGGQDLVPNSVIAPKDITTATNNLISSLTSGAQIALQQQVRSTEQVVSNSLKCAGNTPTADHHVGDQAKSVTVTGTVTCTEEAYDQKGALDIAVTALKAEAAKNPGAGYALVGIVVTNVTSATVVDAKNTVSLVILAQGEWVYQFTDAILTGIKNKIAKESQSAVQADLMKTPGVQSATISISSGTTMPDAANITINFLPMPGLGGSPTPGSGSPTTTPGTPTSGTTPTGSPAITPTTGLGSGRLTPAFTQTAVSNYANCA